METPIESVPWGLRVPVLSGNVEELFGTPRANNKRAYTDVLDRMKLEAPTEVNVFEPELVQLNNLTPCKVAENLEKLGLRPAPLREYLSLCRMIEAENIDMKNKLIVYANQFPQDTVGENWIRVMGFFQNGSSYEGISLIAHPLTFLPAERKDRDYHHVRYAVAMR